VKRIKETISNIKPLNEKLMQEAQKRLDNLTKPRGSLGRLEELAKQIVGIKGEKNPKLEKKVIFTLAGDHGVVEEGVSAYPQEVTSQMVYNFLRGGAGINVLARHIGARVVVVDVGVKEELKVQNSEFKDRKVGQGTRNMAKGPAMSREEAIKSLTVGIELFEEEFNSRGIDILGIGDMGIGNTTASSAIIVCLSGEPPEKVTGRGTGIDGQTFQKKVSVIKRALEINKPNPKDPIDILSKVGGFEIGGLAGLVLGAASQGVPVVLDGFISTAGALIAYELCPLTCQYMIASHKSVEVGHQVMLKRMGLEPLLDLNLRLGEGTGACLGISIISAGVKVLKEMATFGEAGVSEIKK
jgi:nicotinate-nucleotide--dimethylbenzimidazole phosphoribosyltransferase